jgi:hypothetical protein
MGKHSFTTLKILHALTILLCPSKHTFVLSHFYMLIHYFFRVFVHLAKGMSSMPSAVQGIQEYKSQALPQWAFSRDSTRTA